MTECAPLQPIDAETFDRMLRYALVSGGDQLHFQAGHRPQLDGLGGPRPVRFRQLTIDDTAAIAGHLLERCRVSERLQQSTADSGQALYAFTELPGEALFEARFRQASAGIALTLDVIRPMAALEAALEIEAAEL